VSSSRGERRANRLRHEISRSMGVQPRSQTQPRSTALRPACCARKWTMARKRKLIHTHRAAATPWDVTRAMKLTDSRTAQHLYFWCLRFFTGLSGLPNTASENILNAVNGRSSQRNLVSLKHASNAPFPKELPQLAGTHCLSLLWESGLFVQ